MYDPMDMPVPETFGASLDGKPHHRDYVFSESGGVKRLRGRRWELVHYPGQPYGELYDLQADPGEVDSLYDLPAHRNRREEMTRILLDRLIHTEAARHTEALRGPAFWRTQRARPFGEPFEDTTQ
jgi:arylsulfatase A-like enzyme